VLSGCPSYPGRVSEDSGDIVQSGGRRSKIPNWRLSRGAALLGALGLAAGLAAGYAAGDRHAAGAARPPQRPRVTASQRLSITAVTPALTQTTSACSAQVGRDLQLGVQITNQSGAAVTLGRVQAVLPLGGLRVVSQQWAPCGVVPVSSGVQDAQQAQDQSGGSLAPGASAWFTVTFKVLLACPRPLPVQFTLDYDVQGLPVTTSLPGFPDLSEIPYTGCPA
jgi:hypothetical protein